MFPIALFVAFLVARSYATNSQHAYCAILNPQASLDIEQIMGMWYGTEVIPHLNDEEGIVEYESCPVIHLSETTHEMTTTESHLRPGDYGYNYQQQQRYGTPGHGQHQHTPYGVQGSTHPDQRVRYLRLLWDETGNNLEYNLKFNNSRRGFWIAAGPQNGSMLERPYNQFAGTVQVLKAVGNHLVLSFCQRMPDTQLFTIVLSRLPNQLTRQDVQSVHSMLGRRGLSTSSVRKVCQNGSSSIQGAMSIVFAALFFSVQRFL